MALPGFTAESSIGPTTQVYRVQDRYGIFAPTYLHPQSIGAELDQDASWDDDSEGAMPGDEDVEGMEGDEESEVGDEV